MKRNWYAVAILLVLTLLLAEAGRYVEHTTGILQNRIEAAYALAVQGDYPAARQTYEQAAAQARKGGWALSLLEIGRASCRERV